MKIKKYKYPIIIFVIALIIRLIFICFLEDKLYFPDAQRYDSLAQSISESGSIGSSSFTAPLYPLFLAFVYKVFGHSIVIVRIMQSVIGALVSMLIFMFSVRVWDRRTALLAGLLAAVYPFSVFFCGLLLTETLFTLLLLLLVWSLFELLQPDKRRYVLNGCQSLKNPFGTTEMVYPGADKVPPLRGLVFACGILTGLNILIKPIMIYFLWFVFMTGLLLYRDKKIFKSLFCVLIIAYLTLVPWVWRNYRLYNKILWTTTGGGVTLYESNNPRAAGGPGYERIDWPKNMAEMDAFEVDEYFKSKAVDFIKNNPGQFLKLAVKKQLRFWSFIPNAQDYRSLKYNIISVLSFGFIFPLALYGIIRNLTKYKRYMCLFLPVLFFSLVHTIILGSIRYRVPIAPYLIMFSAWAIVDIIQRIKKRFLLNSCFNSGEEI